MNKLKKTIFTILLIFILFLLVDKRVFASTNQFQAVEYSEDFKKWLELSDEEKQNVMQPRAYDVLPTTTPSQNIFYKARMLGASISQKYDLRSIIPANLKIRDQKSTLSCWALATLSSLETNLALYDYKQNSSAPSPKVYDFSERHMDYATSQTFTQSAHNDKGYNRQVSNGGNYYIAQSYLTNGMGAINEADMEFEDSMAQIELSAIQGKDVTSQVYDTIEFPNYNEYPAQKTDIMRQIKQHIKNYGSVYASIHGNSAESAVPCYNNSTGAIYCSNASTHKSDHAVSIVGWDDNYSKTNFSQGAQPTSNGAWIIRNSWGEKLEYNLSELKERLYQQLQTNGQADQYHNAQDIPNEVFTDAGYTIQGDKAYLKLGNNGFMYVSYEDQNVGKTLWGIIKATNSVNYQNIYQYDEYFPLGGVVVPNSKAMLTNIFAKQTGGDEYLTQVSLYAPETYTCKVYVNPNGTEHDTEHLRQVSLKAGETETFNTGYHTLEFAQPVKINATNFAVVIEIQGTNPEKVNVSLESKPEGTTDWDSVTLQDGKCFIAIGNNLESAQWLDLSKLSQSNSDLINGDSTIKAFTTSNPDTKTLQSIQIIKEPDKTQYFVGEDFEKEGMKVQANYSDESHTMLFDTDYNITNGTNLVEGQESVTISYENQTTTQAITVEKNTVSELTIETEPTKKEYIEGENFDPTGMVVKATYKDGTTKAVSQEEYTIEDGNNLEAEQTTVTISYEGKSVTQAITVTPNALLEISITKAPNKTQYVVGQNFAPEGMIVTGTYQNGDTQEILDYTVENGTNLSLEQTSVTIKYKDKTVTQAITVVEKMVTEIVVDTKPTKLTYIKEKEDLDLTGGTLKITYNDGTTETISMTAEGVTVSGFSNNNLGNITITLTYQNKTAQFEVQIIEEAKAENSNLNSATSDVKKVKAYYYTNNSEKDYILIDVEIDNITLNKTNDEVEYYYYLSPNANEEEISGWVKITQAQSATNKLQFTIDSRNVSNYNEISDEGAIYLYVKEVAIKGGDQSIAISKPIRLETDKEVETYVDDVKKDNLNPTTPDNDKNNGKDDTTAPGGIPDTGITSAIIICITVLAVFGVVAYIKYNKFKDAK